MLKYGMKERENNVESTNDFNNEIQEIIIKMDVRREHKKHLSSENIREKLCSINPSKMGEFLEFEEEFAISQGELTPDLALEVADIVFYTSQPNCPEDLKHWSNNFEKRLEISHSLAQRFCILKYNCRLEQPVDSKNYKEKEREVMVNYFNNKNLGIFQ